jgi:hypothetical protein
MMMRIGWTLWHAAGMGQHQAYDFLVDGFGSWSAQPEVGYEQIKLFLRDLFDRLDREDPVPYSSEYGARAWAGTELYMRADQEDDHETLEAYRACVYHALVGGPPDCIPARSYHLVSVLAQVMNVPNPFA